MELRPDEHHLFMKNARRLKWDPKITSAAEYGLTVQVWWRALQPQARRDASDVDGDEFLTRALTDGLFDWGELVVGGRNGLWMVVLALIWWDNACETLGEDRSEFLRTLRDVEWVLERIADSLKLVAIPEASPVPVTVQRKILGRSGMRARPTPASAAAPKNATVTAKQKAQKQKALAVDTADAELTRALAESTANAKRKRAAADAGATAPRKR